MSVSNVTYMRYHKVEKALEADRTLRQMLGPKEHTMYKPPNNVPCKFCEEVVSITQQIHDKGFDASSMTNREIMAHAIPYMLDRQAGKPLPKPKLEPEAAPKPKVVKPKVPVRRRSPRVNGTKTLAAADAPKRTSRPKAGATTEITNPPVAALPPVPPVPPVVTPAQHFEEKACEPLSAVDAPLPPPVLDTLRTAPIGKLPYVYGVTINTLQLSCLQVLEGVGLKDSALHKRISDISDEVTKITVIPRPTHAKESSNSASRNSPA